MEKTNMAIKSKTKESYLFGTIAKALFSLNNECLKIRDMQKLLTEQGDIESVKYLEKIKRQHYRLIGYSYRFLYRTKWLKAPGFYIQTITTKNNEKRSHKIYIFKLGRYTYYSMLNISNRSFINNKLGEIDGVMQRTEEGTMTGEEAVKILTDFTKCTYHENENSYRTPKDIYLELLKYYSK